MTVLCPLNPCRPCWEKWMSWRRGLNSAELHPVDSGDSINCSVGSADGGVAWLPFNVGGTSSVGHTEH